MSEVLEKLIETLDWDDFQATMDGNIHCFSDTTGLVRFCYRIGLHLKRPMETIMAKGDFIRFRPAPQFGHFALARLDPENVDRCLYEGYQVATDSFSRSWHPKNPVAVPSAASPNQFSQVAQAQVSTLWHGVQGCQGLVGLGGSGGSGGLGLQNPQGLLGSNTYSVGAGGAGSVGCGGVNQGDLFGSGLLGKLSHSLFGKPGI